MNCGQKPTECEMIKSRVSWLIGIATLFLMLTVRAPTASAWQLGWGTTQSSGYSGIASEQWVAGAVPSSYFFASVSAMTDTSSVWHAVAMLDESDGSLIETEAEYNNGNYHDTVLCSGLNTGTYYTDEITWDSSSGGWLYSNATDSSCTHLLVLESGTPTINSAGTKDFMESNDGTASDFSGLAAEGAFDYSMQYESSGGSWYDPTSIAAYNNAAVSSLGTGYTCYSYPTPPSIVIASTYAPPPTNGAKDC
jgi:hypothetical protein